MENIIYEILQSKKKKIIIYILTIVFFISSLLLVTSTIVKVNLLAKPLADNFSIYVDLPEGKSVYETKEVTSCIIENLKNEEIITDISIFLGENLPTDFSSIVKSRILDSGENIANIVVNLKKEKDRDETSMLAVHRLRPIIQEACATNGTTIKFIELPAGPPTVASLVLELTNDADFKSMVGLSKKLKNILKTTNNVVDVDIIGNDSYERYTLQLNNSKIIDSELEFAQVKKILYLAFEGMNIAYTNNTDIERQVPIYLSLNHNTKIFHSSKEKYLLDKFSEIKLMNKYGMLVPLSELISLKKGNYTNKIISKNLSPIIRIVGEADDESQIYLLLEIRDKIFETLSQEYDIKRVGLTDLELKSKKDNKNYYIHFDGEQKLSMDTINDLGMALGVAIVLIFFLMVIYYSSFSLAFIIILASFISLTGVIYAHLIYNLLTPNTFYMSATSLIGFIALIGINSRNSLLIIDFTKQLIKEKGLDVDRAISISVSTRAKPILLTVLAILFASILLTLDPVFGGLGIALIGGTLVAYLVSLFVVPIMIQGPLKKLIIYNLR